jgi:hypothetical protein
MVTLPEIKFILGTCYLKVQKWHKFGHKFLLKLPRTYNIPFFILLRKMDLYVYLRQIWR